MNCTDIIVGHYQVPGRVLQLDDKPQFSLYQLVRDYKLYLTEYRRQLNRKKCIDGEFELLTIINSDTDVGYQGGKWWIITTNSKTEITGNLPDINQIVEAGDGIIRTGTHEYCLDLDSKTFWRWLLPIMDRRINKVNRLITSITNVEYIRSPEESRRYTISILQRYIHQLMTIDYHYESEQLPPPYRS